jgi:hypothetical protein
MRLNLLVSFQEAMRELRQQLLDRFHMAVEETEGK